MMWHHAGRPTTGHSTETIGLFTTSPQETDHFTLFPDKLKIKARISPKSDLDLPFSFNQISDSQCSYKRFFSVKLNNFGIIRKLSIRRKDLETNILSSWNTERFPLFVFWITTRIDPSWSLTGATIPLLLVNWLLKILKFTWLGTVSLKPNSLKLKT